MTIEGDVDSGLSSTVLTRLENEMLIAADTWGQYLDPVQDITFEFVLELNYDSASGAQARHGGLDKIEQTVDGQSIFQPNTITELTTGVDSNGSAADFTIFLAPKTIGDFWGFDTDPETRTGDLQAGTLDFQSLFLHEMGHALGVWRLAYGVDGDGLANVAEITTFERHIENIDGAPFFTGENVVSVWGSPVPIPNFSEFYTDHISNTGSLSQPALMNGVALWPDTRYFISPLDIAVLADVGVPIRRASDGDDELFGFESIASPEFGNIDLGRNFGSIADAFLGADKLMGGLGDDTLWGLSGDDTLRGDDGADQLDGGTGSDFLSGGGGDDSLVGGNGDDQIFAGAMDMGNDSMNGGNGADTIGGGGGDDLLVGGVGEDVIFGGADNDTLWGGILNSGSDDHDDALWAGTGDDLIYGAVGDDAIGGGAGDDTVNAGAGNDIIYGGKGDGSATGTNDVISGDAGNDTIFASAGNDVVNGGEDDDVLYNGSGSDTVNGGVGDDTVWGGGGDDQLEGGSGSDVFVFGEGNGKDAIMDFSIIDDTLDLTSFGFADIEAVKAIATDTVNGLLITVSSEMTITLESLTVGDVNSSFIST